MDRDLAAGEEMLKLQGCKPASWLAWPNDSFSFWKSMIATSILNSGSDKRLA
jgi:hypothetical protein